MKKFRVYLVKANRYLYFNSVADFRGYLSTNPIEDLGEIEYSTGLKDKKGNDIYENDILFDELSTNHLRTEGKPEQFRALYKVFFGDGGFCTDKNVFLTEYVEDLEIIGNIHDEALKNEYQELVNDGFVISNNNIFI